MIFLPGCSTLGTAEVDDQQAVQLVEKGHV